jgi:hypothetical protein
MSIPIALLAQTVTIRRRQSTGRDSLNNPVYGAPTDGLGWSTIYEQVPVRLAFSSKMIRFVPEGERITPNGVMYYNTDYILKPEDRVLTSDGIEYTVISVVEGRMGLTIDHYEAILQLP